jgi:hypothetical protein
MGVRLVIAFEPQLSRSEAIQDEFRDLLDLIDEWTALAGDAPSLEDFLEDEDADDSEGPGPFHDPQQGILAVRRLAEACADDEPESMMEEIRLLEHALRIAASHGSRFKLLIEL